MAAKIAINSANHIAQTPTQRNATVRVLDRRPHRLARMQQHEAEHDRGEAYIPRLRNVLKEWRTKNKQASKMINSLRILCSFRSVNAT
jgi:hypothetical protein